MDVTSREYAKLFFYADLMFHASFAQAKYGIEFAQSDMKCFRVTCLREFMQHKLDLRGAIVPFSLLKVIQQFKIMDPGETLEVCCSDPETPADLFKVLPPSSYELISLEEIMDGGPSYQLTLVKKQLQKRL
jgi:TusA-related sulfurtransferase